MNVLLFLTSFIETEGFQHLCRKQQKKIIEKKQQEIINYAKRNSEYYKKIIPDKWKRLEDIPPTTKKMWMDNFDDILTDKSLTFEQVWEHYKNYPDDAVINDKYAIVMTSGTTGAPVVLLRDREEFIKDSVRDIVRACKLKTGVLIVSSENYSIEKEKYAYALGNSGIIGKMVPVMLDCQDSYEYLAEQINKIRPGFIATYTSPIKLIAEKMAELGYRVPVKIILCSGEDLTELDRCEIQKGFPEAEIHSLYACSEASTIATECRYGHLHINEDTVKIEAVDNDFNVLPYGVKSDQTLITVYGNKVQPVIRYGVGDRITLHKSDCPCGCRFDWLEIQGRTSDIVYFDGKNGEKTGVSPLTLMINMDRFYSNGVENFNDYQIIVHPENKIELRLAFIEPCNHNEVFDKVKKGIIDYLSSLDVEVGEVYLSDVPPEIPDSGVKKRRIYRVNE